MVADGDSRRRVLLATAGLVIALIGGVWLLVVAFGDDARSGVRSASENALDGIGVGEPGHREAARAAARVVAELIEPLPDGMKLGPLREACGQGADPLCTHLLSVEAPAPDAGDILRAHLLERGWSLTNEEHRVYEHPDGGWLKIERIGGRESPLTIILHVAGRS